MEDESTQQALVEEETINEDIESKYTPETNNLVLNEENYKESVDYFQADQDKSEILDSKSFVQESKVSNETEANCSSEEININIKSENGIYKEKIDPKNFYEMISYQLYRTNAIEKDYPIDLCLDVQESIDNILPFLQKSIINKRNR